MSTKSRLSPVGLGQLCAGLLLLAAAAGVAFAAPIVDCPLGFRTPARDPFDHVCCETCHFTGKMTPLEAWTLRTQGKWPDRAR